MKVWKKSKGNRIRASDKSLVYHFCIPCTETGSACRDRYAGTAVPAWDGSSCVWTGR